MIRACGALSIAPPGGEARTILFGLSGQGHFDPAAYDSSLAGNLQDHEHPQSDNAVAQRLESTRPPTVAA